MTLLHDRGTANAMTIAISTGFCCFQMGAGGGIRH